MSIVIENSDSIFSGIFLLLNLVTKYTFETVKFVGVTS